MYLWIRILITLDMSPEQGLLEGMVFLHTVLRDLCDVSHKERINSILSFLTISTIHLYRLAPEWKNFISQMRT